MNYSKKGVRQKQKALNSKSAKWGRKFILTCVRMTLIVLIALAVFGASAGIGLFQGVIAAAPDFNIDEVAPPGETTIVFDCEGNEIDRFVSINANRIVVHDMDLIPRNLANAFVAIEDERFYEHNGIDIRGIARSGYQFFITGGEETQGGSTITQQLLKNIVFTDWTSEGDNMIKKIKRKLQEQYLAIEVTKDSTKDDILLRYMNIVNLGQNTLGVEAASQRYFGKSCSELTLSECAVIASITQNPSGYNPLSRPERNEVRRKNCLNKMLELGFITQSEYNIAMADTEAVYVRISNHNDSREASSGTQASYFTDALQKQVLQDLIDTGIYNETTATNLLLSGGLRIHSTLDPKIQAIADAEIGNEDNYPDTVKWLLRYALTINRTNGDVDNYGTEDLKAYFQENINKNFDVLFNSRDEAEEAIKVFKSAMMLPGDDEVDSVTLTIQPQASLTIIDQKTGYVVAIVGGRGDKEGRLTLNRGTDTVRQPGSTFKVVGAYAAALDSAGLTLATVYDDAPFNYANGRPVSNWYGSSYRGRTNIRNGIKDSLNVVTVKVLTQITPQLGFDYLLNLGFTTLVTARERNGQVFSDINQSMALGGLTDGVTNLELNASFATIANGGLYITPKLYSKVLDRDGNVVLDNTRPQAKQVLKETTAFLLNSALVDAVVAGTGGQANFPGMPIAGKTGTTSDNKDVWFAGYTPYYTCTTWIGYDNNVHMNSNETVLARRLWRAVMSSIHEDLPNIPWDFSLEGIVQRSVCVSSGKLPIPDICHSYTEYFALGTEPTDSCNIHYHGPVCPFSDNLPATEYCQFRVDGIRELPLIEDPSLHSGYPPNVYNMTNQCMHTEEFFQDPNNQPILEQQMEMFDAMQQPGDEESPPHEEEHVGE